MVGNPNEKPNGDTLYMIPITDLGLSADTIKQLQAADVASVGDLIDLSCLLRYATVSMSFDVMALINGEVKEKLQKQGYWSYVENN
jgi:hypothetical protein